MVQLTHTPSHSMTMKTAIIENAKVTSEKRTRSTGNTVLLMRTFLSSGAASRIEVTPWLVESAKIVQMTLPRMR